MTIEELHRQTQAAFDTFWFLHEVVVYDRTDATITLHLTIQSYLFIQIFLSEGSNHLNNLCRNPMDLIADVDKTCHY